MRNQDEVLVVMIPTFYWLVLILQKIHVFEVIFYMCYLTMPPVASAVMLGWLIRDLTEKVWGKISIKYLEYVASGVLIE